jgi:hypothetical protein
VLDKKRIPQHVLRQLRQPTGDLSLDANGTIRMKRRFCYRAVRHMAQFLLDVYGRKR